MGQILRLRIRLGELEACGCFGRANILNRFGQARALKSDAVRVVAYTPYRDGEGVYATFQFFYRSEGESSSSDISAAIKA